LLIAYIEMEPEPPFIAQYYVMQNAEGGKAEREYQYFPDMEIADKQNFIYTFFPFMFGIYPYTFVTEKQRIAMEEANVNYVFMTIYEITYNFVKKFLD